MAKYTVEHSCGHSVEHNLFGKSSGFGGRDSKLEWLERQPCLECKRKQEAEDREAQAREAAEANLKIGAPPLLGSEKQVAWAEVIRRQTLVSFREAYDRIAAMPQPNLQFEMTLKGVIAWLMGQAEAKWWIDTIGTLKSKEGLAPIFGLIDGHVPKASEAEILRHVLLDYPQCTEELANALGWGEAFRARVAARAAIGAQAELRRELEAKRPARPAFLQALRDKHGEAYRWNGKVYSGRRIYVCETEIRMTPEQETELATYQKAFALWLAESKKVAGQG